MTFWWKGLAYLWKDKAEGLENPMCVASKNVVAFEGKSQ